MLLLLLLLLLPVPNWLIRTLDEEDEIIENLRRDELEEDVDQLEEAADKKGRTKGQDQGSGNARSFRGVFFPFLCHGLTP